VTLLAEVVGVLTTARIPHALIGAAAPALKLLAGGPKDAWDILALLEVVPSPEIVRGDVETVLPRLPADARGLWARLAHHE
jgi:hypothetical protein